MKKELVLLASLCAAFSQAQYTVEILHSGLVPAASSYGAGAGGGQQVGHTNQFLAGPSHALLWQGTANSLVDLHPAGWDASYAMATDGVRQVGWRERHTGNTGQFATMWSGAAKGWVDLHNPSFGASAALGIAGDTQVGVAMVTGPTQAVHAALWQGSAASLVDLHPSGFDRSEAWATDGKQQVGYALDLNVGRHAALWTGSAASHVDLHPSGYEISEALGVAENQQVGFATVSGRAHAIAWQGSNASFVDLNPGKDLGSRARATNGSHQVGEYGSGTLPLHAAVWSGSSHSMIDLHGLLPQEYSGAGEFSSARGIDAIGNIVGWATHVPTGAAHAVLWTPVPEPSTVLLLGLSTLYLIWRREKLGN